jgi:hypothetical protein
VPPVTACLLREDLLDNVLVDDDKGTVFIQPDAGRAKSPAKLPLSPKIEGTKPDTDTASWCTVVNDALSVFSKAYK